jgi:high-affinity iron transporter
MYKTSTKLPMGLFFTATAILLYYLAFTFVGRGVLELQEARWLPITPEQWLPHIEWLGMFPTWEAFSAQLLFLLPLPLAWYLLHNKNQQKIKPEGTH